MSLQEKIQLNSQRTLQFSRTIEYQFSIDSEDHRLVVFESSGTGIEYWLNGELVEMHNIIFENTTLGDLLLSFQYRQEHKLKDF